MATCFGEKAVDVSRQPLRYAPEAQVLYDQYRNRVDDLVDSAPLFLRPSVSKHYFSAGSAILILHLYGQVMQAKLSGGALNPNWHILPVTAALQLCPWLSLQLYGLQVVKNEICLAPADRADPPMEVAEAPRAPTSSMQSEAYFLSFCVATLV